MTVTAKRPRAPSHSFTTLTVTRSHPPDPNIRHTRTRTLAGHTYRFRKRPYTHTAVRRPFSDGASFVAAFTSLSFLLSCLSQPAFMHLSLHSLGRRWSSGCDAGWHAVRDRRVARVDQVNHRALWGAQGALWGARRLEAWLAYAPQGEAPAELRNVGCRRRNVRLLEILGKLL